MVKQEMSVGIGKIMNRAFVLLASTVASHTCTYNYIISKSHFTNLFNVPEKLNLYLKMNAMQQCSTKATIFYQKA
ncbi:hypothetical protein BH10BAC2_BH10BAC2_26820 [soil metagenome]